MYRLHSLSSSYSHASKSFIVNVREILSRVTLSECVMDAEKKAVYSVNRLL